MIKKYIDVFTVDFMSLELVLVLQIIDIVLVLLSYLSGDFHALRDALNKHIQDNCFNTKSTFDFVTDETFSSSLLQTLSTLNRGITRKNAFNSLITRLRKFQRVIHVIEHMARTDARGCRPSVTTFYPGLSRRVVDFMSTLGVNLDLTGHNYFFVAHCYAGDVAAVAGILKKMEEDGIGLHFFLHSFKPLNFASIFNSLSIAFRFSPSVNKIKSCGKYLDDDFFSLVDFLSAFAAISKASCLSRSSSPT
ncbi:pentatricopeptide repeat-containing protein At3g56030-like [Arachis ipaensis]|uniref:pentatricopeptide repeat-containing protein At3g56030-like n=1 Tax=Arachis ipaensis TaxID=130454 RepID=UPI000A2B0CE3|nr:pentatricopeptide repeat-containing protein At3g56030-like [Arachis ipaensis]